jgi:CheY-like chemotaxis protein
MKPSSFSQSATTTTSPQPDFQVRRVLIIDDNALVRSCVAEFLSGFISHEAASGEEAITLITKNPDWRIDVVITDFQLPGANGVEVCRKIKKLHPATKTILLSGSLPNDLYRRALQYEFDLCFTKPVGQSELQDAIDSLISRAV